MKKIFVTLLLSASISYADNNLKMGGYFRSGVGQSQGKERICISNGTSGNEFRLGNECGTYAELGFNYGFGADKYADAATAVHITLAPVNTANQTATEAATVNLIEAYGDFGKPNDIKIWAGKRYYRWSDVHQNDWFYFANINGTGAGVENVKASYGTWALGYMQESATAAASATDSGQVTKTVLDARLGKFIVADDHTMDFWLNVGNVSGGKKASPAIGDFASFSGHAEGVRLNSSFGDLKNTFALVAGQGAMGSRDMTVTAVDTTLPDTVTKQTSILVLNNVYTKFSNWDLSATLMHEVKESGPDVKVKTAWTSIGARPTYYLTDMYSISTEVGYSVVKVDSLDDRKLTRATVAFQVQPAAGLFTKPTLRFYASHNTWNNENTLIKASSPILTDKTNYLAVGTQIEVWF
ncbi:MAG: hypothetical protein A2622_04030 [Bdellovibrionales bacterium RIFCSPHIGHO2_01_FULL_40_29]|nr:MAG: hypothetical protein A2622_04030 [Bdellovibrionales bacterium RIFCSPHIGHO2_01_FULL_40_29]OFZ35320.1 MAG: hypothetical protein A3D17_08000 [Bdellovibrionales bacterium RIFCSPHIGHO2_02_FULL_40_15]